MTYTFSNQAIGALMMALQKSLMEQTDIVPVLKSFDIKINEEGEIVIMNPPVVDTGEKQSFETSVQ